MREPLPASGAAGVRAAGPCGARDRGQTSRMEKGFILTAGSFSGGNGILMSKGNTMSKGKPKTMTVSDLRALLDGLSPSMCVILRLEEERGTLFGPLLKNSGPLRGRSFPLNFPLNSPLTGLSERIKQ